MPDTSRKFPKLWTPDDVAEYMRVTRQTVYAFIKESDIPFKRIGRVGAKLKRLVFVPEEVIAWIDSQDDTNDLHALHARRIEGLEILEVAEELKKEEAEKDEIEEMSDEEFLAKYGEIS